MNNTGENKKINKMRKILNLLLIIIFCSCKQNTTESIVCENCKEFEISFKKDYQDKIYITEMLESEELKQLEPFVEVDIVYFVGATAYYE